MQSVHLRQLKFRAYHGLYEEEQKTGSDYEVNVSVDYTSVKNLNELQHTIDYVQLYQIINQAMTRPRPLLEMVADEIAGTIQARFHNAESVSIEIWKLNPPIENFEGKVGISVRHTFPSS